MRLQTVANGLPHLHFYKHPERVTVLAAMLIIYAGLPTTSVPSQS